MTKNVFQTLPNIHREQNSIGGDSLFRVMEQWEGGEAKTQLSPANKELSTVDKGDSLFSLVFYVAKEIRLDTPIKLLNLFLSHTQRLHPHSTHTFQT